jgi:hypothetical protein
MNYTCPYCGHHTTITEPNKYSIWNHLYLNKSTLGDVGFRVNAITCPNKECQKLILYTQLTNSYSGRPSSDIKSWDLLPESEAMVLPDYIPEPIKEDYYEACRIRDLSPKASATLSRRCLQGMIRNFWKITKSKLKEEIDELENKVDSETWGAIDSVRSVGNIGAHMEKDINLMIDVEPEEAQLLIGLIEQLVDDWYIQKHDREERMKKVKELAENKKLQKA